MNIATKNFQFYRVLCIGTYLLVILTLVGCTPRDENTSSQAQVIDNVEKADSDVNSNETRIQIIVSDDQTLQPIRRAEVLLTLPQELHPLKYTDNTGRAIYEVNRGMVNEIAQIDIKLEGYEPQTHQIMLSNTPILSVYLVPVGATAVPRETPTLVPTETPIPPTPRPEDTQTPVPTNTNTPTATATVTATSTQAPALPLSDSIFLTRREGADTVYVVAGPDESNVELGTLGVNENAEVIGRTTQNEWLYVITDRGVQGWVANCEVALSTPNLSAIPVTWEGQVTAKDCLTGESDSGSGTSVVNTSSCVNVTLSRTDWPNKSFDDILLIWSNVPGTATRLELWVTGPTNDGVIAYVIHPTFSDVTTPYEVELFKFEDGDFKPGATYTYVVRPYNGNNLICTTQGTFVP